MLLRLAYLSMTTLSGSTAGKQAGKKHGSGQRTDPPPGGVMTPERCHDRAMDDDCRLLRLISLVAYTEPDDHECGLRLRRNKDDYRRLDENLQSLGHDMCMHYSGAVRHHRKDRVSGYDQDWAELPDWALRFVTALTEDAVTLLGTSVCESLRLLQATPTPIGRQWVEDVTATCWRLKLARVDERFGL
ncbi:hypothetical protein ACFFQW_29015 [Umezawaea endophytica]|uniref:Uncharacterized protein n=1 Tax=Umezawaea endophytica TaxID=1654476 RepID=A0A9X3AJK2_9PSEU|nr:hypothetical protein [Umezawaea endophytica]MCS7484126.1 hypothetical protein [Umezawaea endophytica]